MKRISSRVRARQSTRRSTHSPTVALVVWSQTQHPRRYGVASHQTNMQLHCICSRHTPAALHGKPGQPLERMAHAEHREAPALPDQARYARLATRRDIRARGQRGHPRARATRRADARRAPRSSTPRRSPTVVRARDGRARAFRVGGELADCTPLCRRRSRLGEAVRRPDGCLAHWFAPRPPHASHVPALPCRPDEPQLGPTPKPSLQRTPSSTATAIWVRRIEATRSAPSVSAPRIYGGCSVECAGAASP
jgi:hypothetical protein